MKSGDIAEWYSGRSILITGGTGFMGKVLLEKLLRACPGIKCIYILCRAKRGFSPAARVSEIVKLPDVAVADILARVSTQPSLLLSYFEFGSFCHS
ncbi:hypothetical protein J6590_064798 [Homalodisca vitripennis]|nr:hypothetical protein J6590_064798 [Homalodisca vitripennis]